MNRFDKAIFDLDGLEYEDLKAILECLNKGMRVHTGKDYERAVEDFPELKITHK